MNNRIAEIRERTENATPVILVGVPISKHNLEFLEHAKEDMKYLLAQLNHETASANKWICAANDYRKEKERLEETNKALESDIYNAEMNLEHLQAEVKGWQERHNQAALNWQQENQECRNLQAEITQLKAELADYNCDTKIGCKLIEVVKAERDAAVKDLEHIANEIEECNYEFKDIELKVSSLQLGRCDVCTKKCYEGGSCNFEWRGLQEVEKGDAE